MAAFHLILALVLAPLLAGIINRVKAKFGGRMGKPYLQLYYDIAKLLQKGAVYPAASSWVFRTGPMVGLAATVTALCLLPLAGNKALFAFTGDFLLAAYLLAMGRFATVAAALDTGSAFEGMGASREVAFAALAEPVFLLGLMPLGLIAGTYSLSFMLSPAYGANWSNDWPVLILLSVAFFFVTLVENCRIPADDPNTHLELTMIHEVMVLDHGGVELAFIEYGAALKLWFFAALISGVLLPSLENPYASLAASLAGVLAVALAIGVVESVMARLRLMRVPQIITLAGAFAALACLLSVR